MLPISLCAQQITRLEELHFRGETVAPETRRMAAVVGHGRRHPSVSCLYVRQQLTADVQFRAAARGSTSHSDLPGLRQIRADVEHTRHRHQEWLRFLRRLDREFPSNLKLHLVMDNYGTHKEPHVQAWLKKHPRFVCHFVPTNSSWLNLVERWFRELTDEAVRRSSFAGVPDLKQAIDAFMSAWNDGPKPFVWTATVEQIIKKIAGARAKMEQIKPGSTLPRGKTKAA